MCQAKSYNKMLWLCGFFYGKKIYLPSDKQSAEQIRPERPFSSSAWRLPLMVYGGYCSRPTLLLNRLRRPRLVLASSLLVMEMRLRRVGIRFFEQTATCCISAWRRSSAAVLFFSRLRNCSALITMMPALDIRRSFNASSLFLYKTGRADARMSNRRWTPVDTLFTCCPPAPRARMAVNSTSLSGTITCLEIYIGISNPPANVQPVIFLRPTYRFKGRQNQRCCCPFVPSRLSGNNAANERMRPAQWVKIFHHFFLCQLQDISHPFSLR